MLTLEYQVIPKETTTAMLDFLTNRPFLKGLILAMRLSCLILVIAFAIMVYNGTAHAKELATVICATLWLFAYPKINRWIINSKLKRMPFASLDTSIKIDDKSILCQIANRTPFHIEWKKLSYLQRNKDGYIIPLTGLSNAGKFIWLPQRAFAKPELEQEFLDLVAKFKLKTRNIN